MSFSAVCRHMRKVFWYSHFDKISLFRLWSFPLFPYAHTYSAIEPSIDVVYIVLHARDSVIVQPPSRIYLDFLKAWFDGLYRPTGR